MRTKTIMFVVPVMIFVLMSDLVQRTLIPIVLKCFPRKKEEILAVWVRWLAAMPLHIARVTGVGNFDAQPMIPSESGVLILMNHQSILDIPMAILSIQGGYPIIVTREGYAKGIPLISGIVRMLEFPTVKPRDGSKTDFKKLDKAAKTTKPLIIYPEGARSRDGELLPFQDGALNVFLKSRKWKVYLLVVDGIWPCGTFYHITSLQEKLDCKKKVLGPFDSPDDPEEFSGWLEEMEGRMTEGLVSLRGESNSEVEEPLTLFDGVG